MDKIFYEVKRDERINFVNLSQFSIETFNAKPDTFEHPVNLEESYIQIVYPQRRQYISELVSSKYVSKTYDNLYIPFENEKIEFSSFIGITSELKTEVQFFIDSEQEQEIQLELITCGSLDLFQNEEHHTFFAPMTRNIGTSTTVVVKLNKGDNKFNVFLRDLAERDVFFYLEIINRSDTNLRCSCETKEDPEQITRAIKLLDSFYLNKDEFLENDNVILNYEQKFLNQNTKIKIQETTSFINPIHQVNEFKTEVTLDSKKSSANIDNFDSFPIGTYPLDFCITIGELEIKRLILLSKYIESPSKLNYEDRRNFMLSKLSDISQNNITKALILASENKFGEAFDQSFNNSIKFVDSHADCADFQIVPLIWLYSKYENKLSEEQRKRTKEVLLRFRYWIDEPGNDAMWYFSENHAFLFHIAQYLVGNLFTDEVFVKSNRTGKMQYKIGKERVVEWFETFKKYEFAEWNSTTYFPVDFIGFITLYECAPDDKIREYAKCALDRTFDIIQLNLHHNLMGSTYGRVYENELKGLRNGELSNITWLYFNKGYFNTTNRAVALCLLTSYEPTNKIDEFRNVEFYYEQGYNNVGIYGYKTDDYSITAAINYNYLNHGHQQHILNISMSKKEIQLWLNNPGEKVFSGENRPSYWAGNGINPQVFVDKKNIIYNYDNSESYVKYTHMYFPTFSFDEYKILNDRLIARIGDTFLGLVSTSKLELTTEKSIANREIRFVDAIATIFISLESNTNMKDFTNKISKVQIEKFNNTAYIYTNKIKYTTTNNQFFSNGKLISYEEHISSIND